MGAAILSGKEWGILTKLNANMILKKLELREEIDCLLIKKAKTFFLGLKDLFCL